MLALFYKMAQLVARSLISCPKAYLQALKYFYASTIEPSRHPTSECIEKHVSALISDYVGVLLRGNLPFCVLGVGSGEGDHDLSFIEMLSKTVPRESSEKCQFFQRAIEPDENVLKAFRDKAEDLPESLKKRADIEFEWCPMTFQEYVEQKGKNDVKFDVVHFFHSLYYVGLETALEHCYDKELGANGIIVCAIAGEESAIGKYYSAFSSQGLILNPGAYYNSKDVIDVVKRNGWKYVECPGDPKTCDITAIFDCSSVKGNHLLAFLTHWANIRLTASRENLQKILNFWADECTVDDRGRRMISVPMKTVVVLKGR